MEVDRNPRPPVLSKDSIELLTQLCFRTDNSVKKVDGIFVFSSAIEIKKISELLKELLKSQISDKVFISGGYTPDILKQDLDVDLDIPESELVLNSINISDFPDVRFFTEEKSTNTYENVEKMLVYNEFKNLESILFIFKSHACGRGYLTLRKFFRNAKIYQKSFDTKYSKANMIINRETWSKFEFGKERVWGEYLRIMKYGMRGDIEYEEVKELVNKINEEVATK